MTDTAAAKLVFSRAMIYLERAPAPFWRPWVRSLWYCCAPSINHTYERVLPNGCVQIIVNLAQDFLTDCSYGLPDSRLPSAIVVGASQCYKLIATKDLSELAGFVLEPGGFPGLFGERADLLLEKSVAVHDLWPRFTLNRIMEARTPANKLDTLECLLQENVGEPTKRFDLVASTLDFLKSPNATVKECARSEAVSERRLLQIFREQVGLSPKSWCRIQRFQAAVTDLHRGTEIAWADLALRCGYYDQSHFINDFRAFSGITPTAYSSLRGAWQNHVAVV